jgi:hypothetical protein
MAAWTCAGCSTAYAVGAPACPQCGSTKRTVDSVGALQVPALTVACQTGGCPQEGVVRRVVLTQVVPGVLVLPTLVCAGCRAHLPTVTEENTMPKITVHGGPSIASTEGSEQPSLGTNSSTSSETAESKSPSSESKTDANRQPARTTGSRSSKGRTGKSSARSTDGGQTAGTSATADGEA